jgi:hypothetical protein
VGGGSQTGSVGGGSTGGGPAGGNGQGATEPTWVEIDSLVVPIDGTTVQSSQTLQSGTTYRLRASGYFDCRAAGAGCECDAEYVDRSGTPDDFAGDPNFDFGIAIDTTQPSAAVPPAWGAPAANHVYQVNWPGSGAPITATLLDPVYTNNSGNDLRVQIFEYK